MMIKSLKIILLSYIMFPYFNFLLEFFIKSKKVRVHYIDFKVIVKSN